MTRSTAACSLALALLATAIPATAAPLTMSRGAYQLQVIVDGRPVSPYSFHNESWVLGHLGERYTLRVINRSGQAIEAVVSVDGRDVIDGKAAAADKGGYLVPAYDHVDIDGWRISSEQAAAFRFSSVPDSYAAQTGPGREVGVIGVAIYRGHFPAPRVAMHTAPPPESCCTGASNDKPYDAPMARGSAAGDDARARLDEGGVAGGVMGSVVNNPADGYAASKAEKDGPMSPPATAAAPAPRRAEETARDAFGPAGSATLSQPAERSKKRAGLGTEYGEAVSSSIREVQFERSSSSPACFLGARYNDRDGFIAMGFNFDAVIEQDRRETANPFPVVERGYAQPPPNWRR